MGAGGTLGSSRARQSRVQAGHHRQAAWLAWVDPPPILPTYPYRAGNGMAAWQAWHGLPYQAGRAAGGAGPLCFGGGDSGGGQGAGLGTATLGAGRAGNQGQPGSRVRARAQAAAQPGRWAGLRAASPNPVWVGVRSGAGSRAGCGHKKECPSPCSGPAAPTLHPWVCAWACSLARVLPPLPGPAGPWVRSGPHGQGRLGLARPLVPLTDHFPEARKRRRDKGRNHLNHLYHFSEGNISNYPQRQEHNPGLSGAVFSV